MATQKGTSITQQKAFDALDSSAGAFPIGDIEYLQRQQDADEIVAKIVEALEKQALDPEYYYDSEKNVWYTTSLWYAVVAEKHLDKRLFKPIIALFSGKHDWDYMHEQAA